MSIQEIGEKCKEALLSRELYTALLILLVGLGSFGLGRLSVQQGKRAQIRIEYPENTAAAVAGANQKEAAPKASASATGGQYVASKTGTKYHLPWCAGAKSIKEENKIWFDSKEEAEKAGYQPAGNCKGI